MAGPVAVEVVRDSIDQAESLQREGNAINNAGVPDVMRAGHYLESAFGQNVRRQFYGSTSSRRR